MRPRIRQPDVAIRRIFNQDGTRPRMRRLVSAATLVVVNYEVSYAGAPPISYFIMSI